MVMYKKRYGARRVGGRRVGAPRRRYGRRGAAGRISRSLNPTPTFVETFRLAKDNVVVPTGGGIGKAFKVQFNDIPQWLQYTNLYTQYRINWVKVMAIPQYDTTSSDPNASIYNASLPLAHMGMCRVAYAVQDSPNVTDPATEAEVLSDNGAKVKPLGAMWKCSFKPVPDLAQATAAGQIPTKQKFKQWFNIDTALVGNNPAHGAVAAYFSLPGSVAPQPEGSMTLHIYYKVSFTLRDPK